VNIVRQQLRILAAGTILIALLASVQIPLHRSVESRQTLRHLSYLPSGEYLRMASLGYREMVADILWLQTIQVMGERKISEEEGRWLYRAFDVITTIDPTFVRAYEAGGLALCTLIVMPEESNRLLEKGMRYNPREWKLPFIMGINYYFELADDTRAAESMELASRLPGAPEYTARLAAKLYVKARSPQQAIDLLMKVYEETPDANVRQALEVRLKETIVERDLGVLEEAIGQFRRIHQRLPAQIDELVGPGFLSSLPIEPFGGRYLYEPSTGKVRSSEVKERLRVTTRRRGQYTPD
jgi:tetratricopeptide (TPR) repeat protein